MSVRKRGLCPNKSEPFRFPRCLQPTVSPSGTHPAFNLDVPHEPAPPSETDKRHNGIVLEPFDGEPIVGEVLEREGVRSGRWRLIEMEWLN